MRRFLCVFLWGLGVFLHLETAWAFRIPSECRQLVVGIVADWDSSEVMLRRWIRMKGKEWKPCSEWWPGRVGREGVAWGRGIHPVLLREDDPVKKEGDHRAPAGVFELGGAYGHDAEPPEGASLRYHQVSERDLWVEDPTSKHYNMHVRLYTSEPLTEWQKKQQMKVNDPAHRLKLFIKHNAPPRAVPNRGSAIFFHIWRDDGQASTAGCTTMSEENLRSLIRWIDPALCPLYVLLPNPVYQTVRSSWRLP